MCKQVSCKLCELTLLCYSCYMTMCYVCIVYGLPMWCCYRHQLLEYLATTCLQVWYPSNGLWLVTHNCKTAHPRLLQSLEKNPPPFCFTGTSVAGHLPNYSQVLDVTFSTKNTLHCFNTVVDNTQHSVVCNQEVNCRTLKSGRLRAINGSDFSFRPAHTNNCIRNSTLCHNKVKPDSR